jgi:hypothetical protein
MQIQQLNRTDAEKVFIAATNGFATTLTTGYVCCFDLKGDSSGATVSQAQTGTNSAWYAIAGVANTNIAAGGVGLIQVYGVGDTLVSTKDAGPIEVGQVIGIETALWYLVSNGLSDGKAPVFIAAEQVASNTQANKKVFIRAL